MSEELARIRAKKIEEKEAKVLAQRKAEREQKTREQYLKETAVERAQKDVDSFWGTLIAEKHRSNKRSANNLHRANEERHYDDMYIKALQALLGDTFHVQRVHEARFFFSRTLTTCVMVSW